MGEAKSNGETDHLPVQGNWFEKLLHKVLNKVFRHRDIVIDGELYLRRWFLTPRSWSKRLFLHCILRSDEGTHLHDHPWDFRTRVLARGYVEVQPACFENPTDRRIEPLADLHFRDPCRSCLRHSILSRNVRPRGRVYWRWAKHVHRVEIPAGQLPSWTLVTASRARRNWGFWVDGKWVDWRTHLGCPEAKDHPEDVIR